MAVIYVRSFAHDTRAVFFFAVQLPSLWMFVDCIGSAADTVIIILGWGNRVFGRLKGLAGQFSTAPRCKAAS